MPYISALWFASQHRETAMDCIRNSSYESLCSVGLIRSPDSRWTHSFWREEMRTLISPLNFRHHPKSHCIFTELMASCGPVGIGAWWTIADCGGRPDCWIYNLMRERWLNELPIFLILWFSFTFDTLDGPGDGRLLFKSAFIGESFSVLSIAVGIMNDSSRQIYRLLLGFVEITI